MAEAPLLTLLAALAGACAWHARGLHRAAEPRRREIAAARGKRDVIESDHRGVNSCIVKPIDFGRFTETVRQPGLYWLLLDRSAT